MSFLNWQGIYVGTKDEGIETEIFNIGNKDIRGCIACGRCGEFGKCVFDDPVNEFAAKFKDAEGLSEKEEHAWTNFI